LHESRTVVAFRKTLALHQTAFLEHGVREEKAIGRHEIDAWICWTACQQRAQYSRGGALAGGDAAADGDDVGNLRRRVAQKTRGDAMKLAYGGNVQIQQTRKREIDLLDLGHRQRFIQAAQLRDVVRRKRHRRLTA